MQLCPPAVTRTVTGGHAHHPQHPQSWLRIPGTPDSRGSGLWLRVFLFQAKRKASEQKAEQLKTRKSLLLSWHTRRLHTAPSPCYGLSRKHRSSLGRPCTSGETQNWHTTCSVLLPRSWGGAGGVHREYLCRSGNPLEGAGLLKLGGSFPKAPPAEAGSLASQPWVTVSAGQLSPHLALLHGDKPASSVSHLPYPPQSCGVRRTPQPAPSWHMHTTTGPGLRPPGLPAGLSGVASVSLHAGQL